ncbi:hypothetical protein CDD83_920 [Cordyceps sp. RAO-2017]|nr:hypothetical protein CDD83_920 [Cordyceps sp. RAO-2017]
MKTAALLAALAPIALAALQPLALAPPADWAAGSRLFPAEVIAGYHANLTTHTRDSWAAYVLEQCRGFDACDSTVSYSEV